VATAEADFGAEPTEELAAQRRARYLAHVRAQGKHLRTGAEILASPPDSTEPAKRRRAEMLAFQPTGSAWSSSVGTWRSSMAGSAATEALGRPVPSNDLWSAASASAAGLPLVTLNRRHFEPLTLHGLRLL
jgi:predicted nucleic acid-binding protein